MSSNQQYVPIPGSDRTLLPGSQQLGPVASDERIEVSVYLRPRSPNNLATAIGEQLPHQRQHLSREEFATNLGAHPDDLAKVEAFAGEHDLAIVKIDSARRVVVLAGTAATLSEAFGVELQRYEHKEGTYRGRTGQLQIPADLALIIEGVFGLDNRPQAQPHFRLLEPTVSTLAATTSYTPPQLAQLYNFPTNLDGQGQCIAIIELGGGYRKRDLSAYFTQLGIKIPTVLAVSVDGGHNSPSGPNSADGEVDLDIEVAGAVAPGAKIVVYFAPNTDQGFLDAITTAIHDTQNKPSVISISWGAPESGWTNQAMQAMDKAFQDAATLGVTVCCASGDNGSGDGVTTDKLAHVDFPASSPYALGCGGTRLESSGNKVTSEVVWNEATGGATGGGVSDVFNLPSWQTGVGVPASTNPGGRVGRGVPDVSGNADPATGYQVRVDGQTFVIGGTSAVAPLWAGLLALINQQLGHPVGYLNPLIYQQLAKANVLRDVTSGNNGTYQAGPGWDACTGLGTPDGVKLLTALQSPKS